MKNKITASKINKVINFLDKQLIPYLVSTKTYKQHEASFKYEIYPEDSNGRIIKLWCSYEDTDDSGFIEYPLVIIDFILTPNSIEIQKEMKNIYLKANEKKTLLKLLKNFLKGIKTKIIKCALCQKEIKGVVYGGFKQNGDVIPICKKCNTIIRTEKI